MTSAWLPAPLVLKEGRALAPIWLAAAAAIVTSPRLGLSIGVVAFVLGAVALGVFSIGHEYAHRTLTGLLAQPISRRRLLLSKTAVLATMLVLLTALAAITLLSAHAANTSSPGAAGWRLSFLLLTPLLGLCVAPYLTMVCRSIMAGLVFTLAVPAALWIAGQILRAVATNFDAGSGYRSVERLAYEPALTLMIAGVAAVSIVAAMRGWRMFVGLEALDASRDMTTAPARSKTASAMAAGARGRVGFGLKRSPLAQLVYKEVRLQGLSFALVVLYALGWIALSAAGTEQYLAGQSFAELTAIYGLFIALLIGAVSIAEERSLGTAQWQLLQPLAFWKQWLVKLVTVGLLALLLGLAVPIGLETAFPLIVDSGRVGPRLPFYLWRLPFGAASSPSVTILLVALFSAYASTLCSGGLRGLLVALAMSVGLASLLTNLVYAIYDLKLVTHSFTEKVVMVQFRWQQEQMMGNWADLRTADEASQWIQAIVFVGFVGGILYLCFRNSRSSERVMNIAMKQIPVLAAYVALTAVLAIGSQPFLEWWLLTH